MRFNPPPNWPTPPPGWTPGPDWKPDPAWPAPPPGWQFWISDAPPAAGPGPVVDGRTVVEFHKVWLTHTPPKASLKPKRFTGTLRIGPSGLSYVADNHRLEIGPGQYRLLGAGSAGSDIVNSWALIGYRDRTGAEGQAYLNDGRYLGWGGIFGGAKKLQQAIAAATGQG